MYQLYLWRNMESVTFLFLVILIHLVPPAGSAASEEANPGNQNCAPFYCGRLGNIRFPFYNNESTAPVPASCQYYPVNCTVHEHPKIQLKEGGHWYEILNMSQGETMFTNGRDIQNYLEYSGDGCKSLESFGLPVTNPTINVSSPKELSVFKCNSSSRPNFTSAKHFFNTNCGDYSIYYTNTLVNLSSFPHNQRCSFIRLPAVPNRIEESISFSSHFNDDLRIELHINYVCLQCERRNRECLFNKEKNYYFCASEDNRKRLTLVLGLGIAFPGVLILMVCLYCLVRKFSFYFEFLFLWKKPNQTHQNVEAFLKKCGHIPTKRYSYLDVKKMTNSFTNKIGQGGFGCVYRGNLPNGHLVAVKVLNQSKGNGEEFINEVASISRTSHVNIVSMVGFCFEGSKRALIYEFMHNGSLEKFLFQEDQNQIEDLNYLEWGTLYQISLGIARGLEYLHCGCNTRILHFDIKPHNILLDRDFTPKISDFGLAKICTREESIISMLEARGTVGYIAPEVFYRSFGGVSHKSDVYSYGMLVLEMVGGRKNVNVRADHTSAIYFPQWIYRHIKLDRELGLKRIKNEEDNAKVRKMITMSLWCIQTDPSNRPTMSKVIEMLEGSLDSLQVPPKPFLSSPPGPSTDSSSP